MIISVRPSTSTSIIGVFKGMGDLLCASPVIRAELENKRTVHVLLFPICSLTEFANLIDFSPNQHNLHFHQIPRNKNINDWIKFLKVMRSIKPELVWISPHAPVKDSSWKVPIVLKIIQMCFWTKAKLIGADSERLSWLFYKRLHVDRALPYRKREWNLYCLYRGVDLPPPTISFVNEITDLRKTTPLYDLVIHPGANAENRKWPIEKYGPLIKELPLNWKIAVAGLPDDLANMKRLIPPDREIRYISGTIKTSIKALASAKMLLVMDSGNVHFAQVLNIPALVICGCIDPTNVIEIDGCIETIYEPRFACQPCMRSLCNQTEVLCLTSIHTTTVSSKLITLIERL